MSAPPLSTGWVMGPAAGRAVAPARTQFARQGVVTPTILSDPATFAPSFAAWFWVPVKFAPSAVPFLGFRVPMPPSASLSGQECLPLQADLPALT